ncbi:cation:proton antiporter domain-containing protein [Campylobacter ureolyticus]|uniref:cation:proton antiporter domain-containing protein n=1 Tax=Campylobacter ureolyticus TaxID=827 RepID=UPI002114B514|nr:cation:proton antiporter [Campylobacter ureolyticus]
MADIGFYYLMFLAGTEVDLKIFINAKKGVLKNSSLFLGLLYIFSIIAVYTFGLSELFIVIIPVMSVGILSILYKEYGKNENWLNLAMLVGVIGEVLSIALLTLLNAYTKYGLDIKLFVNLGALAGFLIVTTLIFRWLDVLFWWYPNLKKNNNATI